MSKPIDLRCPVCGDHMIAENVLPGFSPEDYRLAEHTTGMTHTTGHRDGERVHLYIEVRCAGSGARIRVG